MQAVLEVVGRILFAVSDWMVSLSLQFIEWSKALGRVIQGPEAAWLREPLQSVLQGFARLAQEVAVFLWRHGVDVLSQAPVFGPTVVPSPSDLVLGVAAIAIPLGMLYAMFFGLAWLIRGEPADHNWCRKT